MIPTEGEKNIRKEGGGLDCIGFHLFLFFECLILVTFLGVQVLTQIMSAPKYIGSFHNTGVVQSLAFPRDFTIISLDYNCSKTLSRDFQMLKHTCKRLLMLKVTTKRLPLRKDKFKVKVRKTQEGGLNCVSIFVHFLLLKSLIRSR